MNPIELSLKHMAWSNQEFFSRLAEMPVEIYGLKAAEGEWPIGQILTHFAGSGQWYRYCLGGERWSNLEPVTDGLVTKKYLPIMESLDRFLLEQSLLPDQELTIDGDGETIHATRSLILSQAVMHTAEHKAQIAAILKQHGYHIDLDSLDVWSYVSKNKK